MENLPPRDPSLTMVGVDFSSEPLVPEMAVRETDGFRLEGYGPIRDCRWGRGYVLPVGVGGNANLTVALPWDFAAIESGALAAAVTLTMDIDPREVMEISFGWGTLFLNKGEFDFNNSKTPIEGGLTTVSFVYFATDSDMEVRCWVNGVLLGTGDPGLRPALRIYTNGVAVRVNVHSIISVTSGDPGGAALLEQEVYRHGSLWNQYRDLPSDVVFDLHATNLPLGEIAGTQEIAPAPGAPEGTPAHTWEVEGGAPFTTRNLAPQRWITPGRVGGYEYVSGLVNVVQEGHRLLPSSDGALSTDHWWLTFTQDDFNPAYDSSTVVASVRDIGSLDGSPIPVAAGAGYEVVVQVANQDPQRAHRCVLTIRFFDSGGTELPGAAEEISGAAGEFETPVGTASLSIEATFYHNTSRLRAPTRTTGIAGCLLIEGSRQLPEVAYDAYDDLWEWDGAVNASPSTLTVREAGMDVVDTPYGRAFRADKVIYGVFVAGETVADPVAAPFTLAARVHLDPSAPESSVSLDSIGGALGSISVEWGKGGTLVIGNNSSTLGESQSVAETFTMIWTMEASGAYKVYVDDKLVAEGVASDIFTPPPPGIYTGVWLSPSATLFRFAGWDRILSGAEIGAVLQELGRDRSAGFELGWLHPESNGGNPLTGYVISYLRDGEVKKKTSVETFSSVPVGTSVASICARNHSGLSAPVEVSL